MLFSTRGRRAFAVALSALTLGGLMAAPITARADDPGKTKKDGKGDPGPIIIGPATIVKDPPPPPPPKKDKK